MKKFFQKIKNSDVAIPIIAGVVSVLIIGGIIAAVVVYCVRSDKSNGSSSAASAISLDFNFNTSKSTSSALKAKKNKPGASSEVTSVTVGSAPAGVPAVTGGDTQSGGDNNPARPQPRPNTAISHPGTMANVKPTDRAGLAKRNSARAAFLADTFCRDFYNEDFQLLASEYPYKSNEKIDTAWGFGALQSMQTVIARMQKNSKQIARLKKINEGLDYYGYKKNGKFWGYVVNRNRYLWERPTRRSLTTTICGSRLIYCVRTR